MAARGTNAVPGARTLAAVILGLFALSVSILPASAQGGDPLFVPGEVLVKYRATSGRSARSARTVLPGSQVMEAVSPKGIYRMRLYGGQSVQQAVNAYLGRPDVESAQPNYIYRATTTPNDPDFTNGDLWAMRNTGQSGGTAGADIGAVQAWTLTTGSPSVEVAVIDTGIDRTHPDLAANIDTANAFNALVPGTFPTDDNAHGSHVSGTIGAVGNNSLGVVGVNWAVKIVPCKFLDSSGSGTSANAVKCIEHVVTLKKAGVNVVACNASWGGGGNDPALQSAIVDLNNAGVLFVAAAGNSRQNHDTRPAYPASYTTANVIAVAATDRNDALASFSDYGSKTVHLGAPGVSIWSTIPGGGYANYSGTSMATPHVTGAIALLASYAPGLTAAQLRSRILTTTTPLPSLTGKTIYGRLSLYRALTNDTSTPPPPPPPSKSLTVKVSTGRTSYRFGQSISITVTVTDGTAAVSGAAVTVAIKTPRGGTYTGTGSTGSTGSIVFFGSVSRSDGSGTYTVGASASKGGYASGTGSTTFTAQ